MTRQTRRGLARRMVIGRRLRSHRLALGLSGYDIAAHTGISRGQITAVETGCQDVYSGTLVDVADALGLDVDLVAEHHAPLLDLAAADVDVIRAALAALAAFPTPAGTPDPVDVLAKLNGERPPRPTADRAIPPPVRQIGRGLDPGVRRGQVWRSQDRKQNGRHVLVLDVSIRYASVRPCTPDGEILPDRRQTRVAILARRIPKYTLIREATP